MFQRWIRRAIPFACPVLAIAACANSGRSTGGDNNGLLPGNGGSSSGASGSSSGPAVGDSSVPTGDDGGNGIVFSDAPAPVGDACQELEVPFTPKIPLVDVLVDRSGSMFDITRAADGGTTDEWDPLRTATLAVIQSLQGQVAFGFTSYTGINPNTTPMMCPILDPPLSALPIALNNFQAISAAYAPLGMPMFKAETPAQLSLEAVSQSLLRATVSQADGGVGQPGGRYILFVTDGETDFCDDGNPVCPADAVIAEIQKLAGEGITTLILGVGSSLSNISVPVLQSFANAGAGLPALAPPGSAQGMPLAPVDVYNQCNSVTGWKQLATAAGLGAGQALGTYATTAPATKATVYSPSATDVGDLTNQIAAALKTVKSCSFDIQGKLKVDTTNAAKGRVTINGGVVPYDPTNGWTLPSPTQIDLVGTACQTWRDLGTDIKFDFPCDAIIVVVQ
ncbi:MAG: hypothetical protein JOZ69_19395 [Myxococcales bacterium]|nr:hypothetical protein [Myxococcales bacterium]